MKLSLQPCKMLAHGKKYVAYVRVECERHERLQLERLEDLAPYSGGHIYGLKITGHLFFETEASAMLFLMQHSE